MIIIYSTQSHLGIKSILSARTNPTVTRRLLAGSTNGNISKINPSTMGICRLNCKLTENSFYLVSTNLKIVQNSHLQIVENFIKKTNECRQSANCQNISRITDVDYQWNRSHLPVMT